MNLRRRLTALLAIALAVGCSDDSSLESPEPAPTTVTTEAPDSSTGATTTSSMLNDEPDPNRPAPANDGTPETGLWVAHGEMTEQSIEIFWAEAEGRTSYELHRFDHQNSPDVGSLTLSDASLIYEGDALTYLDESVQSGTRYWYAVPANTPEGYRWTEAEATTDTEPPTPITGLTAEIIGDEVHLEWDRSSDNNEFARYAIRRSVGDEQSVYYGTGWSEAETKFIDNQLPDSGTITYTVLATDFHDNQSEEMSVTVER